VPSSGVPEDSDSALVYIKLINKSLKKKRKKEKEKEKGAERAEVCLTLFRGSSQ
jgi:hypothetical protein